METKKLSKVVKPKKELASFSILKENKASMFLLFLAEVFKAMTDRKNVYIELKDDVYTLWELYP